MKVELLSGDRLLFCGVGIYMLYRFLKAIFPQRRTGILNVICYCVIVMIAFCVNGFGETKLNLLLIPILYFVFTMFMFRTSIRNGIAYTMIFYAIFAGGEVINELVIRILIKNITIFQNEWTDQNRICSWIVLYSVQFLFLLFIEKAMKKLEIEQNQQFAWYLLIVPTASIAILSNYMYLEFPQSLWMQAVMCMGALLLYVSNASVFLILEKYTSVLNQLRDEEVYKIKQEMEDNNLQDIIRLNKEYRCQMHDIHSYLGNIRMLAMDENCEDIVTLINEMEGSIQKKIDGRVYSGNSILNAILTERSAKAQEEGVDLEIFVEDFLNVEFISGVDMVSMFGNLIDNAMEAAQQCSKEKRKVLVKLFMGNRHMLILHIENNFEIMAQQEGDRMLTTKSDSISHGLGMGIVQKVAQKYGGTMSWMIQEDVFVTILSISDQIKYTL